MGEILRRVLRNPAAAAFAYSREEIADARRVVQKWAGYNPTPLVSLDVQAEALGLSSLYYKDESGRFGAGSFKALGAAYAIRKLADDPAGQPVPDLITATAGNWGRAVAWAASRMGLVCRIYVHGGVSSDRIDRIRAEGAIVDRVAGTYDDAVRAAARDAQERGWSLVSDTSHEGYVEFPRRVMLGYTVLMQEVERQAKMPIDLILVPGGVGGLAGAVASYAARLPSRPRLCVFEPEQADCLYQSALAGRVTASKGSLETIMTPLACAEPSPFAWNIIENSVSSFLTISEEAALDGARELRAAGLDAGYCSGAALGALKTLLADPARGSLAADSRILLIGTEGA